MKVIQLADAFHPLAGGIISTIKTWGKNLPEYDFEVVTNAFRNQKPLERYSDNVIIRRFLPNDIMLDRASDKYHKLYTGKLEFLFFPYRVMSEIARFRRKCEHLKRADYDIFHLNGPIINYEMFTFDRIFGGLYLTSLNDFSFIDRPKVLTLHGAPSVGVTQTKVKVENEKKMINMFDNIICVSDFGYSYVKSYLEDIGKEKNLWSIPNSIDVSKFKPASDDEKLQSKTDFGYETKIIATYAGHLTGIRDLDMLIKSWKEVIAVHPNAHLLFVGEGYQKKYLIKYTNQLKLSKNIEFIGEVENVYQFLKISDLFVFPACSEGFGVAIVEAMACGLPVVSTNVTSIPEIVGDAGIIVEPRNSTALAKAIVRLLDDEPLRKKLGGRGRRRAEEKYSDKEVVKKIRNVYESLD